MKKFNDITITMVPANYRLPVAIFFSAFFVHLLHIGFAGWGKELLSPYAFSDEYLYLHRAWHMAFVNAAGGYMGEILSVSPYARLLTWAYQLLGAGVWVPLLVNSILLSLAVTFMALATKRLFTEKVAWIAGLVGVLSGPLVFFAGVTHKTNLVLFFLACGIYFSLRYLNRRQLSTLFLASLCILSATVERYQVLFIFLVFLLFVFKPLWHTRQFKKMLQPSAVVLASVVIVAGLYVGTGNNKASNMVSPLGINVYVSYAPGAWGGFTPVRSVGNDIISHRINTKKVAEKETGETLSHFEVQWHWIHKAFSYYLSVPQDLVLLQARKFVLLFAQGSQGQPEEYRVWRWDRPALVIAFFDYGMILSLALLAFYFLRKEKTTPEIIFITSSVIVYAFGVWLFFVQERYRMPIYLMLIPFAAYAVNKLYTEFKQHRRYQYIVVLLLVYAATLSFNQLIKVGSGWSGDHVKSRKIHDRRLEVEMKVYNLKQAAIETNSEDAWLGLSIWFNRRNFHQDAIDYANKAIMVAPGSYKGYELLLEIYTQTSDYTGLSDLKDKIETVIQQVSHQRFNSMLSRISHLLKENEEFEKGLYQQDREQVRDIIRRR